MLPRIFIKEKMTEENSGDIFTDCSNSIGLKLIIAPAMKKQQIPANTFYAHIIAFYPCYVCQLKSHCGIVEASPISF
jgi:hypothetical protein